MSNHVWGEETEYFFKLGPIEILDAIDEVGLRTTGRCLPLNSVENRVYEIEVDEKVQDTGSASDHFIVAKFYRPGRWNEKQILQEHEFLFDLEEADISVIPPLKIDGESLFTVKDHGIFYCLFPKKGGRIRDEYSDESLEILGRTIARIHQVGAIKDAPDRIRLTPESFGEKNLESLLNGPYLTKPHREHYEAIVVQILDLIRPLFNNIKMHRIHGDCHLGNIIWRDETRPYFVDFDDMLVGPAVQDIWPILPGNDQEARQQRALLIDAYQEMRDFDYQTLKLIEPLRALRFIHFSSWIAKRWDDPAFKNIFPKFGDETYWQMQINDLRVQYSLIQESLNSY